MTDSSKVIECELGRDLKIEVQEIQKRIGNIELKFIERLVVVETKLTSINGTLKIISGLLGSLFVAIMVVIITLFLK